MPLPIWLAHRMAERLAEVRKAGEVPYLRPDGKTQVTFDYEDDTPVRLRTVLISTQHAPGVEPRQPDPPRPHRAGHPARRAGGVRRRRLRGLRQPDGHVRARRPPRRHRPHRPQDHRRHLRRHGPPRRRRLQRQGPVEGRPLRRLRRPLGGQARRRRRAPPAAARCRWPTPSAWPGRCRSWSRPSAPSTVADDVIEKAVQEIFDLRPAAIIERPRPAEADLPQDRGLRALRPGAARVHLGAARQARRLQAAPSACEVVRPRSPRVVPDVRGLDKTFDYLVPERCRDQVRVGTHGARVAARPAGRGLGGRRRTRSRRRAWTLKPIAKVTGWGPPAEVVDLARWAAWRWAGPRHDVPRRRVAAGRGGRPARRPPPGDRRCPSRSTPASREAFDQHTAVVRVAARRATAAVVALAAAARGNALVVTPSLAAARMLAARLRRSGRARGPPSAGLGRRRGRRRRWSGRGRRRGRRSAGAGRRRGARRARRGPPGGAGAHVARPRRRHRAGPPGRRARASLASPVPSLEALAWAPLSVPSPQRRAGRLAGARGRRPARRRPVRGPRCCHRRWSATCAATPRVVCVLNAPGRARLLACLACGELARCERCRAAVEQRRRRHAALSSLRRGPPGRVPALRGISHEARPPGREPRARGARGARPARPSSRSPAADRRRAAAGRPASTSAPRRCCTRCRRPTWWRSSTSTRSCWRPATGPPSRRSRCWPAPPG